MAIYYNYRDYTEPSVQKSLKKDYEKGYSYIYKLYCKKCGKEFYCKNKLAKYCSDRCTNDMKIKSRQERNKLRRNKTCIVCGKSFTAKRNDTKFCSSACKQKNYRENKALRF